MKKVIVPQSLVEKLREDFEKVDQNKKKKSNLTPFSFPDDLNMYDYQSAEYRRSLGYLGMQGDSNYEIVVLEDKKYQDICIKSNIENLYEIENMKVELENLREFKRKMRDVKDAFSKLEEK